jgi:uncharacterized glyoxalase superfamily protein PhnB
VVFVRLTPDLMVEDVNQTIAFYKDVLDLELGATVPEQGQFDWTSMTHGNLEITFQSGSSPGESIPESKDLKVGGSSTFYVEIEGIEDLYAQVQDKVTIGEKVHSTFYGVLEFTRRGGNGYILGFAGRV